jgi:1-acyl-sn-glycerol-3-phosphate acyltransferase
MLYRIVRLVINLLTKLTMRVEIIGKEKLIKEGSCIYAGNHLGRLDVLLIYYAVQRDDIILIVAEKYQKSAFIRWLTRHLNAIFVDRYNADFTAMRKVLGRLKEGGVFVVSPEGTRSRTGTLIEARPGASYLAAKAGVPIVPVGGTGTEDAVAKKSLKRLRRLKVTIRVGDAFTLPPLPTENREAVLQQYTDEIMCRIAALLPSEYRGFYADHPRLKELLASQ